MSTSQGLDLARKWDLDGSRLLVLLQKLISWIEELMHSKLIYNQ